MPFRIFDVNVRQCHFRMCIRDLQLQPHTFAVPSTSCDTITFSKTTQRISEVHHSSPSMKIANRNSIPHSRAKSHTTSWTLHRVSRKLCTSGGTPDQLPPR